MGSRDGRHARRVQGVCRACERLRGACVGRAWGMCGAVWGVRGACVRRAWGAISVGIARSALLSGYLGKSGHLPRYFYVFFFFCLQ